MCLQQQSVRSGYAPGSERSKLAYPFFFFYLLRVGQILEGLCHKLSKQEVIKVFPCVKIVEKIDAEGAFQDNFFMFFSKIFSWFQRCLSH